MRTLISIIFLGLLSSLLSFGAPAFGYELTASQPNLHGNRPQPVAVKSIGDKTYHRGSGRREFSLYNETLTAPVFTDSIS